MDKMEADQLDENEKSAARFFKITVEELREQRRSLGQLTEGPYAGCSPTFAQMMEGCKEVSRLLKLHGLR